MPRARGARLRFGAAAAAAAAVVGSCAGCGNLLGYDQLSFYAEGPEEDGGAGALLGGSGGEGGGQSGAGGGSAAGGGGGAAGTGAGGGTGGGGAGGGPAGAGGGGGGPLTTPLASNISIDRIVINQGVAIDLMKGGSEPPKNAPVVADRDALLRVYVTPGGGWQARNVVGALIVETGGQPQPPITTTRFVSGGSSDGDLQSTVNFDVPASALPPDAKYGVELHEEQPGNPSGPTDGARWPSQGTASFGAQSTNGDLQVVLVPVQYNADGSGRLPDTSPGQVDTYRARFRGMYPVPDVNVTVHAPYPYSGGISPSGGGWGNVLNAICSLRQSDGASGKAYYHGVFAPASSMGSFCGGGCVAGLCNLAQNPNDSWARCCVGLGFSGVSSADTAVHEVGHAHGRSHAPCGGAQGVDPSYPYSGASIGVWGYDIVAKSLKSPSHKDIMAYCSPAWVSDYNYKAWFNRIAYVNSKPLVWWPDDIAPRMRAVVAEPGGKLAWSVPVQLHAPPGGWPVGVSMIGASGAVLATATGWAYPFDHLPGATVLVPEPDTTKVTAVAIDGYGTLAVAP